MSSARILPRPVTDWSGICRNHPSIPPFPHLNELQLAQVPLPPLAPEDPQEAVQHGLLLWPTAVKILLGQDFYAATDPRKKVSHEKKILKVMQLLQSMEVPLAEWVARRLVDYTFTDLKNTLGFPPAGFIWSDETALRYLAEPLPWEQRCNQSYRMGPLARTAGEFWKTMRIRILENPDLAEGEGVRARVYLEGLYPRIREEHRAMENEMRKRAGRGEFIWGVAT